MEPVVEDGKRVAGATLSLTRPDPLQPTTRVQGRHRPCTRRYQPSECST